MASPYPLRAGKRVAAVLGAAALSLGAFALPAAAQAPAPVDTQYSFEGPVYLGDQNLPGSLSIGFGDDFTPGEHDVSVTLEVDAGDSTLQFNTDDAGCSGGDKSVSCVRDDAEKDLYFQFGYGAPVEASAGTYGYTVTVAVDGEAVDVQTGSIEVVDPYQSVAWPFLHSNIEFTGVEPGEAAEVYPEFLQDLALNPGTAAVVVTLSEPEYAAFDQGADAVAGYDNCFDQYWDAPGVTCIITDFEDLPGTVLTTTDPIRYNIDAGAPGPVDVCVCYYSAYTVNAQELEDRFGDVTWDPNSGNLIGLRTVNDPESAYTDGTVGEIRIMTTEHFYDLAIGNANAKGDKGDEVTLTVPVKNDGPATAFGFFGRHSYYVTGTLPAGLELVRLDSDKADHWDCLSQADFADYLPDIDPDEVDFACMFDRLDAGATLDLEFTVKITDPDSNAEGTLAVHGVNNLGVYPGVLEDDLQNNAGDIGVNDISGPGSGQLPRTGSSLTLVFAIAAAALIAGVLLFVFARRRKAPDGSEEA